MGALKAQLKQPFYVPERERQILERLQAANSGPFPTEALRPVFSEIIRACLSLEHPLRVAFLGPEATFTHMASRSRFGLSARYVPAATMAGVFTEVEKGLADLGVVPIENSTEGVVNSTLDVLIDSELCITAEIAHAGEPLPADALGHARRACRRSTRTRRRWRSAAAGCRRTCRTWRRSRWRRRRWRRG